MKARKGLGSVETKAGRRPQFSFSTRPTHAGSCLARSAVGSPQMLAEYESQSKRAGIGLLQLKVKGTQGCTSGQRQNRSSTWDPAALVLT